MHPALCQKPDTDRITTKPCSTLPIASATLALCCVMAFELHTFTLVDVGHAAASRGCGGAAAVAMVPIDSQLCHSGCYHNQPASPDRSWRHDGSRVEICLCLARNIPNFRNERDPPEISENRFEGSFRRHDQPAATFSMDRIVTSLPILSSVGSLVYAIRPGCPKYFTCEEFPNGDHVPPGCILPDSRSRTKSMEGFSLTYLH